MATQTLEVFDTQTGITATGDNFIVDPTAQVTVVGTPTSAGSATVQVTIDDPAAIAAATATWANVASGAQSATFAESSFGPITGVRLAAASGTWTFKVLQVRDATKDA